MSEGGEGIQSTVGEELAKTEDFSSIATELERLYTEDQEDREGDKDPREVEVHDAERIKRARELYALVPQMTDPETLHYLSYLFQHGPEIEDTERALEISQIALDKGLERKASLAPQATDRLMLRRQEAMGVPVHELRQKFGSQRLLENDFVPQLDGTVTPEELAFFKRRIENGRMVFDPEEKAEHEE